MQRIFYSVLVLTLGFLLSSCGFHLRGHEPLSPALQVLYLQTDSPYSVLTKQLKNTLKTSGVTVVDEPNLAPLTLKILNENDSQQITGVSTNGQTTTYALYYTVNFQLLDNKGNSVLAPQTITVTRNYSLITNQILGDTSLQKNLQTDMRRDAIFQILNRLRSHGVKQRLQQQADSGTAKLDNTTAVASGV